MLLHSKLEGVDIVLKYTNLKILQINYNIYSCVIRSAALCFVDCWVKIGAELSTDHHFQWVRSDKGVKISDTQLIFNHIPAEVGDFEF